MFVRQPQFRNSNADVQIFYGGNGTANTTQNQRTWNKPPGVSHIYMLLIGAGGAGDGATGGGSGVVTVWYGAAQNVPDSLVMHIGVQGTSSTTIYYRGSSGLVLLASAGTPSFAGPAGAESANYFSASGFYTSTAGQAGSGGAITASSTTFLSGGGTAGAGDQTGNYGYTVSGYQSGYFMLQPIIVGVGSGGVNGRVAGIGCGASYSGSDRGGPGMVLIASW